MAKFTEEEYRGILEARERLEEYKGKFQFYPPCPETQEVQEIYHEAPLPNKKLLELQGRVIHCENKILEHIASSKRKRDII